MRGLVQSSPPHLHAQDATCADNLLIFANVVGACHCAYVIHMLPPDAFIHLYIVHWELSVRMVSTYHIFLTIYITTLTCTMHTHFYIPTGAVMLMFAAGCVLFLAYFFWCLDSLFLIQTFIFKWTPVHRKYVQQMNTYPRVFICGCLRICELMCVSKQAFYRDDRMLIHTGRTRWNAHGAGRSRHNHGVRRAVSLWCTRQIHQV